MYIVRTVFNTASCAASGILRDIFNYFSLKEDGNQEIYCRKIQWGLQEIKYEKKYYGRGFWLDIALATQLHNHFSCSGGSSVWRERFLD